MKNNNYKYDKDGKPDMGEDHTHLIKVYSSYDMKAKLWSRPMFSQSRGAMVRSWSDISNDKSHPIGQHPEDYALYEVGTWNEISGILEQYSSPISLGKASDFVNASIAPEENSKLALMEGMIKSKK